MNGNDSCFHAATEQEILDADITKALAKARLWMAEYARLLRIKHKRQFNRRNPAVRYKKEQEFHKLLNGGQK